MNHRIKEFIDAAAYPLFCIRGRKPWTIGYYSAKQKLIGSAIDNGVLKSVSALPDGFGFGLDERVVEYPWVYARIPKNPGVVLDAGSAMNNLFLLKRSPIADAHLTICTLAPEKRCYWNRGISYVFDDLRKTCFDNEVFDTVISISTIEHIGLDNTLLYTQDSAKREDDLAGYLGAIREFRRILKPRGNCFITVPYGKARNHGWFQVFDASMIQSILDVFNPSDFEIDFFGYSNQGWSSAKPDALKDATFFDVHSKKVFDPDMAAGARGLACLWLKA